MERLLIAILGLLFGMLCAIQAKKKNRFTKNWFLTGFVTGPIGFMLISIMPDLSEQKSEPVNNLGDENVSLKTA